MKSQVMGFFRTIKLSFISPSKLAIEKKNSSAGNALAFYIIVVLLSTILAFLAMSPRDPFVFSYPEIIFIAATPIVVIGSASAAIVHVAVRILGGRGGIGNTLKAFYYASTPVVVLGMLSVVLVNKLIYRFPNHIYTYIIWIVLLVWMACTQSFLTAKFHNMSRFRAFMAIIVVSVILFLILIKVFFLIPVGVA